MTKPATQSVYRELAISAGLVLLIVAAYWQAGRLGFVNYDDPGYVYQNPHVQQGLTWDNVKWAFVAQEEANWHPLTWLSHMLDAQWFGVGPEAAGAHHRVNLALHVLNTLVLFLLLRWTTSAAWPSAMVAALFAVHPLHVESVAWVAERKDVLSTLLGLLTLTAYAWYARRPGAARYLLVLGLFALGLMAKPMLVTLPGVMLLLDWWPLARWNPAGPAREGAAPAPQSGRKKDRRRQTASASQGFFSRFAVVPPGWPGLKLLLLEKLPLAALALVSCIVTYWVQQRGGAMEAMHGLSLDARIENALLSYAAYLGKTFWPADLAVLYPLRPGVNPLWVLGAVALLAAITALVAWGAWRGKRYLAVGWLWYLGTLVPVIGLIQVGEQALADRYTYVPLVGIFIMIAWGIADVTARWRPAKFVAAPLAAAVLALCATLTYFQTEYWANSFTLLGHALDVCQDNELAHQNLGVALERDGKPLVAEAQYRKALKINENYARVHNNLGLLLVEKKEFGEAIEHLKKAVTISPRYAKAYNNLGLAYVRNGELEKGIKHYEQAITINPRYAVAHYNLGSALVAANRPQEAEQHLRKALEINPDYAKARKKLDELLRRGESPFAPRK